MQCWRPSQIVPHQVSYEDVAQWIRLKLVGAADISFPTMRPNYNGSLEALYRHITGVTYD